MKETQKSGKGTTAVKKRYDGFTAVEKAAMRDRVEEQKVSAQSGGKADEEGALLEKIAGMSEADRAMAKRIHAVIKATAPGLSPKLWYGMPAYARDGKIVCFFKPAQKFKTRYATLGFNDAARLDEGNMWPVEYALTKMTADDEARIGALVKKAVS